MRCWYFYRDLLHLPKQAWPRQASRTTHRSRRRVRRTRKRCERASPSLRTAASNTEGRPLRSLFRRSFSPPSRSGNCATVVRLCPGPVEVSNDLQAGAQHLLSRGAGDFDVPVKVSPPPKPRVLRSRAPVHKVIRVHLHHPEVSQRRNREASQRPHSQLRPR